MENVKDSQATDSLLAAYQKTEEKLLSIISSQEAQLVVQAEKIKCLDAEIKRLKKLKSKLKFRASKLPK